MEQERKNTPKCQEQKNKQRTVAVESNVRKNGREKIMENYSPY